MKKTLLTIMLAFLALNVFAGKGNIVKLLSGSTDVFNENAVAVLEMDYNGTRWEEDDDYKEWSGSDYEERVRLSKDAFTQSFNATSRGLKIGTDEAAKYKIVFKVTNLEQHQDLRGGKWGQMVMYVTGQIDVVDIETGKNVLCLQLIEVRGFRDLIMTDRIKKAFSIVAERLFGEIK